MFGIDYIITLHYLRGVSDASHGKLCIKDSNRKASHVITPNNPISTAVILTCMKVLLECILSPGMFPYISFQTALQAKKEKKKSSHFTHLTDAYMNKTVLCKNCDYVTYECWGKAYTCSNK